MFSVGFKVLIAVLEGSEFVVSGARSSTFTREFIVVFVFTCILSSAVLCLEVTSVKGGIVVSAKIYEVTRRITRGFKFLSPKRGRD